MSPANVSLFTVEALHLRPFLVLRPLVKAGLENFHCRGLVLDLGTLVLAGHHRIRREVSDAHRRLSPVNVLPALAAGTKDIDAQVVFIDLDVNVIIDLGNGID